MSPRCLIAGITLLWLLSAPAYALDAAPELDGTSPLMRSAAREQELLEQRGALLDDSTVITYLQEVTDRLWRQVHSDLTPPTVHVVIDPHIDAWAYPNGRCYLSTGMLDLLENENQLAMIIAHELVHYARQHTAALYNRYRAGFTGSELRDDHRDPAAPRWTVQHVVDDAERQADAEGLSILNNAGYDQTEVLPLMNGMIQRMHDRSDAATVAQLGKRATFFRKQIGGDTGRTAVAKPSGGNTDGFLFRVAPALMANAQVSLRRGVWDQADRSISRFLSVQPQDAQAHYLKGEILRRCKRSDRFRNCIESYQKALEIDPSFPPAHRALGELYYKAGRYRQAKPYFEAFLSLAPQDTAREFIKGYLRQCQN